MNEVEWASVVSEKLNESFSRVNSDSLRLNSRCNKWLPYRYEIFGYNEAGEPINAHPTQYKTDILVLQLISTGNWLPRVVIETKLKVTTHDALTYSAKAETHKQVHPYLRYGFLMGGAEETVPVRLFRHGAFFDFMAIWKSQMPSKSEFERFARLIRDEVEISRAIEGLVGPKGSKTKKRYSIIQKKLSFEE